MNPATSHCAFSAWSRAPFGRLLLLFGVLTNLCGCEAPYVQPATAAKTIPNSDFPPASSPTSFPQTFTDGMGHEVTLQKAPLRIVSLSPKNTEMLFALGTGEHVVGATTYCTYPRAAARLEKVGGFSSKSLSLERIVSLNPDLILAAGKVHAPIIDELRRLGLPVFSLTGDTYSELREELGLLGRMTGKEVEAVSLVMSLDARIERVHKTALEIHDKERVSVVYVVWGDPLTVAAPSSYLGEMIELCGGKNIVEDQTTNFPKISLEILLARNPQVIVSSTNHAGIFSKEYLAAQAGWSDLQAVRDNHVYLLDGDLVSRCGPRFVDALERMAQAVYPAHFAPASESGTATPTAGETP
jgi:iron complex transport system substrate-binding protein